MLYIPWMVILDGHKIKKTSFKNLNFQLPRVKNSFCANPLGNYPKYCLRQVHLAENLPRATHTQNRVETT